MSNVNFGLDQYSRADGSHPNPQFQYLQSFLPRRLKDLFELCEYVFYNSPHIFAAVEKFTSYPITTVDITTDNEGLREQWERLLDETLKIKSVAIQHGVDAYLYGNAFASVYKPYSRTLRCPKEGCGTISHIQAVAYKFSLKSLKFTYTCPRCKQSSSVEAEDTKSKDPGKINVVRWNPKHIDIALNPITGEREYYYEIPNGLRQRVENNDKVLLDSIPMAFLKAMQKNVNFKFGRNQLFHTRLHAPAGVANPAWGMPPTTALMGLFFYVSVLRRANEAIALDHIAPMRVLHPAAISGQADPAKMINMEKWKNEFEQNIKQWRIDPNHIAFAPAALGVTMLGGQARNLMTISEIKEAEGDIIAGMGIPREFLYGGLSFTGSSVTLRMLENQFETYLGYQNDFLNWVISQVQETVDLERVEAKWSPFRLVDDVQQKNTIMQLHMADPTNPLLSRDTLLKMHDLDLRDEQLKIEQEQLDAARNQAELQRSLNEINSSLAEQARQEAASSQGQMSYDIQAIMAQADGLAQQLMGVPHGQQRGFLDQLSQEDPVMYAVVKDRLDTLMSEQPQGQA